MFKIKNQSNSISFFVALLLVTFVISRGFSMLHDFSHFQIESDKASSVKVLDLKQNFLQKIIFAHHKSSGNKSEHCFLCSAANFQNQISLAPQLAFCVAAFYLAFILRRFDRVKLSFLLSSKAPRAPPVIS